MWYWTRRWTMVHSDPCAHEGSYRTWQFPILLNCEGPKIICMGWYLTKLYMFNFWYVYWDIISIIHWCKATLVIKHGKWKSVYVNEAHTETLNDLLLLLGNLHFNIFVLVARCGTGYSSISFCSMYRLQSSACLNFITVQWETVNYEEFLIQPDGNNKATQMLK